MNKNVTLFIVSLLAATALLVVDYITPKGVATSLLYIFVILAVSFTRNSKQVFFFAFLTTLLSLYGYFFSPQTSEVWEAVTNRTITILSIWSIAFLILKLLKTLEDAESLNLELQKQKAFLERSRKATLSLLEDADMAKYQAVRAKNHAEHIIESSPNGMVVVDNDGKIVDVNSYTYTLLGYTETELISESFESLIPERFRSALFADGKSIVGNVQYPAMGTKQEVACLSKSGAEVPVEVGLNPVVMEEDSYLLGSIVDVTERKKAEQDLKLANSQLKRVNRELSNFAYITSHDLQEPLRSIASFLQLLKSEYQSKLDDDANEYIDFAVDGATRLQGMIRSLLHYSRIDSKEVKLREFDLNDSVVSAQENLYKLILDSKAKISVGSLPPVFGDSAQITQLFQNLIANGIKFRSTADPEISITSRIVSGNELEDNYPANFRYCVVTVADNGIGIKPDYHKRIFNIFQRLHSGKKYPGHGIGLSLCNKIVNLHGGTIWLESEEGKGCAFSFNLPMQKPGSGI